MVRLDVGQVSEMVKLGYISIPVWYDWMNACSYVPPAQKAFQFQYGTIGCVNGAYGTQIGVVFQFQYGTIGCDLPKRLGVTEYNISIPVWYDWMVYDDIRINYCSMISIPVWYDWMR